MDLTDKLGNKTIHCKFEFEKKKKKKKSQQSINSFDITKFQSDSELMVESYSEGEEESSLTSPGLSLGDTGYDSITSTTTTTNTAAGGEIRLLIERKEELEKRQRKQDRHRQRVQVCLKSR